VLQSRPECTAPPLQLRGRAVTCDPRGLDRTLAARAWWASCSRGTILAQCPTRAVGRKITTRHQLQNSTSAVASIPGQLQTRDPPQSQLVKDALVHLHYTPPDHTAHGADSRRARATARQPCLSSRRTRVGVARSVRRDDGELLVYLAYAHRGAPACIDRSRECEPPVARAAVAASWRAS